MTVQKIIPSYLYQEYSDDDDLQGFVAAQNELAQQYLDWFNTIGLPIYTALSGLLLDWVGAGVYGYRRPVLPFGSFQDFGTYNSAAYNTCRYNEFKPKRPVSGHSGFAAATDDVYQRCLTWHFYKGDGKNFDIRWLKRRIMRFLIGANGSAPNIDETYRISVIISENDIVFIGIARTIGRFKRGARYNSFAYNTLPYNDIELIIITFAPFPLAPVLESAINSGALELPFQFTYQIAIA